MIRFSVLNIFGAYCISFSVLARASRHREYWIDRKRDIKRECGAPTGFYAVTPGPFNFLIISEWTRGVYGLSLQSSCYSSFTYRRVFIFPLGRRIPFSLAGENLNGSTISSKRYARFLRVKPLPRKPITLSKRPTWTWDDRSTALTSSPERLRQTTPSFCTADDNVRAASLTRCRFHDGMSLPLRSLNSSILWV